MMNDNIVRRVITFLLLLLCLTATAQVEAPHIKRAWGQIDTTTPLWARNISRANTVTLGLQGRHVCLWQSHGNYYDHKKGYWRWQRPYLFCTTEDLFTQTIVVPYLIPMLENAGAYVFTPRERDWQVREIIVDNDGSAPQGKFLYTGIDRVTSKTGFKYHSGSYRDGENPFVAGTAVTVATQRNEQAAIIYKPTITTPGRYAVYVSYPYMPDALDDVRYTVWHRGIATEFSVNQQIGYGTWVYLGTFDFGLATAESNVMDNCVVLSAYSQKAGHIGADAVRFGGGMGNIIRNGLTSGMPRALEGAKYYCQWAGAPYDVYSPKSGENDYTDDINCRSNMLNWLGGGSVYMPTLTGLHVPFELSVAVHSDAGYHEDATTIYGSMAIATTDNNGGHLSSGITRKTSLDLAGQLLDNLATDLRRTYGTWERRFLKDKNYSETRLPEVPSAIIETLSHQSFPDMLIGQHPYGKFTIARSIYKTILRYICDNHGKKYVIEPLPPRNFRVTVHGNTITLAWDATTDPLEKTATPTSYNVYTAIDNGGFDNGKNVSGTSCTITATPGRQYNFRITACNDGGESFPTETLAAYVAAESQGTILVVNGFERLAAPFIIDNDSLQGFDLTRDEGVPYGLYAGWSGKQISFNKEHIGSETSSGLGYSGNELAGKFIMGNEFNYVCDHTRAIAYGKKYSVASCSLSSLRSIDLTQYVLVDLAFGLQKDDGQLNLHFKTFSADVRKAIESYAKHGGAILTSGAYLGSDMLSKDEQLFLYDLFKLRYRPTDSTVSDEIAGLGMRYNFYHTLNSDHYAATHPEVLSPIDGAICAMQYSDGSSAAVAYKGKCSVFTMGFPFECIKDATTKGKLMQGIINYLVK